MGASIILIANIIDHLETVLNYIGKRFIVTSSLLVFAVAVIGCNNNPDTASEAVRLFQDHLGRLHYEKAYELLHPYYQQKYFTILTNFKYWVVSNHSVVKHISRSKIQKTELIKPNQERVIAWDEKSNSYVFFIVHKSNDTWRIYDMQPFQDSIH